VDEAVYFDRLRPVLLEILAQATDAGIVGKPLTNSP
jgi:hypothetical protein